MITVITPTGDRRECLDLLVGYLARQTFKGPIQWVIVDDGKIPYCPDLSRLPENVQVDYSTRNEPGVSGGSLNRNVITALRKVRFDHVVFMEDDDWYAPTYLAVMLDMLSVHDLVGEGTPIYYNVRTRRYRRMPNREHASLAQTGFRKEIKNTIDSCCRIASPYIDKRIWGVEKTKSGKALRKKVFFNHNLCVSIKSMPGRTGITLQHTERQNRGACDKKLGYLRTYLGPDAGIYAKYYRPEVPEMDFNRFDKPFLILGKGPTFHKNVKDYTVIGLNHVVREVPVDVAHIIDLEVVEALGQKLLSARYVVIPANPHINNKVNAKSLQERIDQIPVLKFLLDAGRLYSYYASTGAKFAPDKAEIVQVRNFSSEAAFNLLVRDGIKVVTFAGVGTGKEYAPEFQDLTPLTNGRENFDSQIPAILKTAQKNGVTVHGLPKLP